MSMHFIAGTPMAEGWEQRSRQEEHVEEQIDGEKIERTSIENSPLFTRCYCPICYIFTLRFEITLQPPVTSSGELFLTNRPPLLLILRALFLFLRSPDQRPWTDIDLCDYFIYVILSSCPWKFLKSGFWVSVCSPLYPRTQSNAGPQQVHN